MTAVIQLVDPQDAGTFLEDPRNNIPYVTMPIEFRSRGWLLDLSPTGIAVLFALCERSTAPRCRCTCARDPISLDQIIGDEGDSQLGDFIEVSQAVIAIDAVSFTLLQVSCNPYWPPYPSGSPALFGCDSVSPTANRAPSKKSAASTGSPENASDRSKSRQCPSSATTSTNKGTPADDQLVTTLLDHLHHNQPVMARKSGSGIRLRHDPSHLTDHTSGAGPGRRIGFETKQSTRSRLLHTATTAACQSGPREPVIHRCISAWSPLCDLVGRRGSRAVSA